jgi:two-component system, LytTR family, response regulator
MNSSVLQNRSKDNVRFLNSIEIYCCQTQSDYTGICHINEKKYLLNSCITAIENRLNKNQFIRTHRSWIVNIGSIAGIMDHMKLLLLGNDEILPYS